jgi:hypothetical protein
VEFEWRCCTVEFQGKFEESYVIDGFKSRSRFGQALASLGDINQDGYGGEYQGKNAKSVELRHVLV